MARGSKGGGDSGERPFERRVTKADIRTLLEASLTSGPETILALQTELDTTPVDESTILATRGDAFSSASSPTIPPESHAESAPEDGAEGGRVRGEGRGESEGAGRGSDSRSVPLIDLLKLYIPDQSRNRLRWWIETGRVDLNRRVCVKPRHKVEAGMRVRFQPNRVKKSRADGPRVEVVYLDRDVVVCIKPSGMLSVPAGDDRKALSWLVRRIIVKKEGKGSIPPLSVVHRLDQDASGLILFARNVPIQQKLQDLFASNRVKRTYMALVHGACSFEGRRCIRSRLVSDRGDGLKGSARRPDAGGKVAITHVQVLENLGRASLVRCELETGRTHQIRIHLAEAGHPILGEKVYIRDYRHTLLPSPRLMLHAIALAFPHPRTGKALAFQAPLPSVMEAKLKRLRRDTRKRI